MAPKVEFLFDFGSPNAYLADRVIPDIETRTGVKFEYVPVLLGGIFKLTGNVSPAESLKGIKNKREQMERDFEQLLTEMQEAGELLGGEALGDPATALVNGTCSLHHQASFYEAQWPEGTTVAPDGDIWAFLTPKFDPAAGDSVTGGGEFVAKFVEGPAVDALQTFLSSDTWANIRVGLGGVISANKGLDPALASSDIGRASVEILQAEDTVFRFDGSDLMPAAVGTGSFWTGMNDWVVGTIDTDELVEYIDDEDVRLDFASAVLGEDLNAGREWVAREMEAAARPMQGISHEMARGLAKPVELH